MEVGIKSIFLFKSFYFDDSLVFHLSVKIYSEYFNVFFVTLFYNFNESNFYFVLFIRGLHYRNFLLHYTFPAFANNEISHIGSTSRREIGHGSLAAKGLRPILPKNNPFCLLLTSTVMESNGMYVEYV